MPGPDQRAGTCPGCHKTMLVGAEDGKIAPHPDEKGNPCLGGGLSPADVTPTPNLGAIEAAGDALREAAPGEEGRALRQAAEALDPSTLHPGSGDVRFRKSTDPPPEGHPIPVAGAKPMRWATGVTDRVHLAKVTMLIARIIDQENIRLTGPDAQTLLMAQAALERPPAEPSGLGEIRSQLNLLRKGMGALLRERGLIPATTTPPKTTPPPETPEPSAEEAVGQVFEEGLARAARGETAKVGNVEAQAFATLTIPDGDQVAMVMNDGRDVLPAYPSSIKEGYRFRYKGNDLTAKSKPIQTKEGWRLQIETYQKPQAPEEEKHGAPTPDAPAPVVSGHMETPRATGGPQPVAEFDATVYVHQNADIIGIVGTGIQAIAAAEVKMGMDYQARVQTPDGWKQLNFRAMMPPEPDENLEGVLKIASKILDQKHRQFVTEHDGKPAFIGTGISLPEEPKVTTVTRRDLIGMDVMLVAPGNAVDRQIGQIGNYQKTPNGLWVYTIMFPGVAQQLPVMEAVMHRPARPGETPVPFFEGLEVVDGDEMIQTFTGEALGVLPPEGHYTLYFEDGGHFKIWDALDLEPENGDRTWMDNLTWEAVVGWGRRIGEAFAQLGVDAAPDMTVLDGGRGSETRAYVGHPEDVPVTAPERS